MGCLHSLGGATDHIAGLLGTRRIKIEIGEIAAFAGSAQLDKGASAEFLAVGPLPRALSAALIVIDEDSSARVARIAPTMRIPCVGRGHRFGPGVAELRKSAPRSTSPNHRYTARGGVDIEVIAAGRGAGAVRNDIPWRSLYTSGDRRYSRLHDDCR